MKTYLVVFFFLFIHSYTFSQNVVYKKYLYPNDSVSSEGNLIDNKPVGFWKTFHINGNLKSIGKWENGKLDSLWCFYNEEEKIIQKINYSKGKKNGYDIVYEIVNGRPLVQRKTLYINNLKENLEYYYKDSNLIRVNRYYKNILNSNSIEFLNNKASKVYSYQNGRLIEQFNVNRFNENGKKEGIWIEYNKRFIITKKETYRNGLLDGELKKYDQNGSLVFSNQYKKGFQSNLSKEIFLKEEFSEDSILVFSGYYYDTIPIGKHKFYRNDSIYSKIYTEEGLLSGVGLLNRNETKTGEWYEYNLEQGIYSKGFYKEDKKNGEWEYFYSNGLIEQTGKFLADEKTGTWTWYFKNGEIRRIEKYIKNKREGLYKEFKTNGEISIEGSYEKDLKNGLWIINSGDLSEKGYFYDDLKNGFWSSTDEKGLIIFKGEFIYGQQEGKHVYYFSNGNVKKEEFYDSGIKTGFWKEFDKDGNLLFVREYRNDELIKINGSKLVETNE